MFGTPSPSPCAMGKEEKKRLIREKMQRHIASQRSEALEKKLRQTNQKQKETKSNRDVVDSLDQEIQRLQSLSVWSMTPEQRSDVKKQIELLQQKKKGGWETAPGRKIFVGKVVFDDLEKKFKLNPPMLKQHIQMRKKAFERIFSKFGEVENFQWVEEKTCFFVTYEDSSVAQTVVETLADFNTRKDYIQKEKKFLEQKHLPVLVAPRFSYYVRWPKNYQLNQSSSAPKKEEEE
eukprot:CAMPEP_0201476018 /NCGR_PEP_ID=MMETSP0151_2-20130828/1318_1 /ASSEMBLY_ACC=CAM_ASM_000257 /TAXON_ID=200890 /ORGANISM="Paramoeba atlantica, Strain 621/1 / CCAP 1560/9" /LENGTH=233 /DNA_ID=CAMNT_0047856277 /DNA_START=239 /DNA_END=940 /DNA_ORIENTATION=+